MQYFYPNYTRDSLYEVFYTRTVQHYFSVANYWKDPHQIPLYLKVSDFLAALNNENASTANPNFKTNFLKIKKLVLVGGPDDGVITPWQSSQFGFYNANLTVIPMHEQAVYTKDLFGLRTLDQRPGGITNCVVPNIEHSSWYQDKGVFDKCVEPWLT